MTVYDLIEFEPVTPSTKIVSGASAVAQSIEANLEPIYSRIYYMEDNLGRIEQSLEESQREKRLDDVQKNLELTCKQLIQKRVAMRAAKNVLEQAVQLQGLDASDKKYYQACHKSAVEELLSIDECLTKVCSVLKQPQNKGSYLPVFDTSSVRPYV